MSNIPEHIANGLRAALDRDPRSNLPVQPGAFVRHTKGNNDETGIVFILSVEPSTETCDIALVHNQTRQATENDLIVFGDETGLNYDLVIQTDVRASTYLQQLSSVIAQAPDDVLEAAADPDLVESSERRGLFLRGRLDSRWDFKVSEVRRLHHLVHLYIHDLLNDSALEEVGDASALAQFDDEVFRELAPPERPPRQLINTFVEVLIQKSPEIAISENQLSLLSDLGMENLKTWQEIDDVLGEWIFKRMSETAGFGGIRSNQTRPVEQFILNETRTDLVKV